MSAEINPTSKPVVDREKTAPFLIRTFVKIGSYHRPNLFEDGNPPTVDEHQLFTWKDATLRELIITLRSITSTTTPEFRHPLAKYTFRTLFVDPQNRAQYQTKDLGVVYSRDLADPITLSSTITDDAIATTGVEDSDKMEVEATSAADKEKERERQRREREERTLEELRFVPGDYLNIAIILPKHVTNVGPAGTTAAASASAGRGIAIKGSAALTSASQWSTAGRGDGPPGGLGRGGGHWRGRGGSVTGSGIGRGDSVSAAPPPADKDRPKDRVPPPPAGPRDRERDRDLPSRDPPSRRPDVDARRPDYDRRREDRDRDRERDRGFGRDRDRPPRRSISPPNRRRGSRYDDVRK